MVDSLRHVLKRDPSLAAWEAKDKKLCGFSAWRAQNYDRTLSERLTRALDEPETVTEACSLRCNPAEMGLSELLPALFAWIGHPIRFDELAKIVWNLKRLSDVNTVTELEGRRGLSEWLADTRWRPDDCAEWRQFLGKLWLEIGKLPRLQRLAYLLNFTAADGQLEVFWMYGVATIRQIGAALEIDDEEYARVWDAITCSDELRKRAADCKQYDEKFALLWQMLPLPDAALAVMLGTERQKVINLRKAAGDRLSRHMTRPIVRKAC